MTPLLTSRQDVEQNKNKLKIGCVARSLVGGEVQCGSKDGQWTCHENDRSPAYHVQTHMWQEKSR